MHPRQEPSAALLEKAAGRAGVLTRSELIADGVSAHAVARLATGWTSIGRGIYRTDPAADPWLARLWAGLVIAGTGSAAYGWTAAALFGFADRPKEIQILSARHRPSRLPHTTFIRDGLGRAVVGDPPRVRLERVEQAHGLAPMHHQYVVPETGHPADGAGRRPGCSTSGLRQLLLSAGQHEKRRRGGAPHATPPPSRRALRPSSRSRSGMLDELASPVPTRRACPGYPVT